MFKGTLKPYQVEAVDKMVEKKRILVAYEMGLGKTPMTIAAIEALKPKLTLVLCLSSLKYQWQKEIQKFSDSTVTVIDGTPTQRKTQYASATDYEYVVMNYEQVVNDWETVKGIPFDAIVCDEATAIKGFRAKRAKKVKELSKKLNIRFALTGTPVENGRPEEIFSIMQFVNADVLGRFDLFDKTFIVRNNFGGVQRYRNLPILHKTLMDWTVRKSQNDEDVKPYLPDAVYREPLLVPLDRKSKVIYTEIAADLLRLLTEARETFGSGFNVAAHYGQTFAPDDPANKLRGELMSRITALRMLCSNHKLLIDSAKNYGGQSKTGSAYISGLLDNSNGQLMDVITSVASSSKLDVAIKYLSDHLDIDDTYKAVVFSSYLGSVKEIVKSLNEKGYDAVAYTGEMNAQEKESAKVEFQTKAKCRVLVSSDAGGYGVDLPQANLLINYDQPWSAGLAVQRNGRIIRAASQWTTITVQDILIKDSIEQRQYDTLKQKKDVAGAILDGSGINDKGGVTLTVGSLIDFLTAKIV